MEFVVTVDAFPTALEVDGVVTSILKGFSCDDVLVLGLYGYMLGLRCRFRLKSVLAV